LVTERLSLTALPALARRPGIRLPDYDVAGLKVGIVHLGVGAFHRAHQAVFTEDCLAGGGSDDDRWGICGFTQRSPAALHALGPQDGLYSVLEHGGTIGGVTARVVGTLREVRSAADDPEGVCARIADPRITVVTLTITEKGFRAAADGRLDLSDEVVQSDLAGFATLDYRPRSAVGQLVGGLELRRRQDSGPISVLPCDNISQNGAVLRRLVHDFCDALPDGAPLAAWIETNAAFPSSMVDRIVPAAALSDRAEAQRMLGCIDDAVVTAEPFMQWVVEDSFAAPRPRWETAGALLTDDVRPYETMKLRLLNATHSLIAYLGALAGHDTIAAALTDPDIAEAARSLMSFDAVPTLTPPDGVDLRAYQESVLRRLANPALRHRVSQVGADGSVKLPVRLLGIIEDRLAAGGEPYWAALAVTAWMICVALRRDNLGRPLTIEDPRSAELTRAVAGRTTATGIVDGLLGVRTVFPEGLAADAIFRGLLHEHARRLLSCRRFQ
jgi:fructuronate reductase